MKNVDTGEIVAGFGVRKTYDGQKDFDQEYIDRKIIQVVKKVGKGEEDYILEEKVIETATPIDDVIQSQFDEAGIQAYLKPFIAAGEDLPDVKVDNDKVVDFTKCPEELADVSKLNETVMKAYGAIDPALKGNSKSVEEFLNSLTQEKIDTYIQSKIENVSKKEEVKKDE